MFHILYMYTRVGLGPGNSLSIAMPLHPCSIGNWDTQDLCFM